MIIEVLICTHNRAGLLERTLEHIDQAACPAGAEIQVLVAANACRDGTHELLRTRADAQAEGRYRVRFIEEPTPGKSNALNTAIPQLRGDIIAMVDDDHRVDTGYFCAIAEAVRRFPDATMYCGKILPDWTGFEPAWVHDLSAYAIYPLPIPHYDLGEETLNIGEEGRLPGGGNLVLKRDVFARVGPFSTELGPQGHNLAGGEDTDFVQRALIAGERIVYWPPILQYHVVEHERLTLKYLLEKSFQRSSSATRIMAGTQRGIPRYLWRKLASYGFRALASLYWPEKRFYMVRVAAALGEIRAYLR
ncbi:MAG: glycosyltransferase family 2 protein [Gammaproteobacteria bacterium]|nr:glycosyltransferase family 2 protein [Gammaproteobacteria bacterium]